LRMIRRRPISCMNNMNGCMCDQLASVVCCVMVKCFQCMQAAAWLWETELWRVRAASIKCCWPTCCCAAAAAVCAQLIWQVRW
jgi:hypothetical protein